MCYCAEEAAGLHQAIAVQEAVQAARQALRNTEICRCPKCGYTVSAAIAPRHACPNCGTDDNPVLMVVVQ